ncbi:hypothetical protein JR316_0009453 [Psilocybe cubensis]|uniref:Uncharacterized protein n=1 Tax=Psilocybe cubensis TaxID=181762 RepID=A0ACB8GTD7_PSICU|nr:hypothetical protein JR316_0009453 [Psilocybe cubensis]KAH9478990.1 hypothetical protein JR316_0009453 [Psilocybe cubensis]
MIISQQTWMLHKAFYWSEALQNIRIPSTGKHKIATAPAGEEDLSHIIDLGMPIPMKVIPKDLPHPYAMVAVTFKAMLFSKGFPNPATLKPCLYMERQKEPDNRVHSMLAGIQEHLDRVNQRLDVVTSMMTTVHAAGLSSTAANSSQAHPTPGNSSSSPTNKRSRRRSSSRLEFMASVRELIDLKLGGPKMFDPRRMVSADELEDYLIKWDEGDNDYQRVPCCDINNFRIAFNCTPNSPWNKSASWVFAKYFMTTVISPSYTIHDIQKYFIVRCASLLKAYNRHLQSPQAAAALAKQMRHTARKNQKYSNRLETCKSHPYLRHHVGMVEQLGPGGMSSDESDYEPTPATAHLIPPNIKEVYHLVTLRPVWRAPEVSRWLSNIDSFRIILRSRSPDTRGNYPYVRFRHDMIVGESKPVKGLPVNTYDLGWIATRVSAEYDAGFTNEAYVFVHDPRLLE